MYQSIELDLLYKTAYMAFFNCIKISGENSKYISFNNFKNPLVLSILPQRPSEKLIAKNIDTSSCSPFDSASNHIMGFSPKRSSRAKDKLEH
jgi:hypothetical protein